MKYKNEYKISYNVKMNLKPEGGRETLTPYTNLHYTTVRAQSSPAFSVKFSITVCF